MANNGDETSRPLLDDREEGPPAVFLDIKRLASCTLASGVKGVTDESKEIQRKLIFALIICFVFMLVEVIGGVLANSLAVLTDAAHLLSDVSGFGVALFANYFSAQSSINTHTFGYHRIEVLGALVSVLSTWLVTGILLWEAINRIRNPVEVNGKMMFILALVGVAVNAVNFFVLGHHGHSHGGHDHSHDHSQEARGHSHSHGSHSHDAHAGHGHNHDDHTHDEGKESKNINLHGAVLHVIGDLVQSVGVAVAGALIWWKQDDPRWNIADPICTFLFAILVLLTTRAILRDISDILMERVPRGQDAATIQSDLEQIEGVQEVHDLHVWALTPGIPLLAVHLNLAPGASGVAVLQESTQYCRSLGIEHSTIQLTPNGEACCGTNIAVIMQGGQAALESSEDNGPSEHNGHDHGSGQCGHQH